MDIVISGLGFSAPIGRASVPVAGVANRPFLTQNGGMDDVLHPRSVAVAGPPPAGSDLPPGRLPAYALLADIRSAWNVGSMFRTADAVGLAGLFLAGVTATPPRPDLEKTALGASETVPWDYWPEAAGCAEHLRRSGIPLVVLEQAPGAVDWEDALLPFPHCFVVGHEVRGVAPELLAQADLVVEIPMFGAKRSLNVAVSFGLLAYQVRRKWSRAGANGGRA